MGEDTGSYLEGKENFSSDMGEEICEDKGKGKAEGRFGNSLLLGQVNYYR